MICSWVRRSLEIKIMAQSLSVYSKLTWLRPNKCLLIFRGGPFRLPLHRVWLREQIQMLYAKRQTHGCPANFWSAHNAAHKCIFLAILFLRCSCHAYILITDTACSCISISSSQHTRIRLVVLITSVWALLIQNGMSPKKKLLNEGTELKIYSPQIIVREESNMHIHYTRKL